MCFLLLLLPGFLWPEELILPEQEAPEAIFETEIGDADVDFYLSGSWRILMGVSADFLFAPDGSVTLSLPGTFPGLEQDRLFEQIPDLTASVWLMDRYFLEYSVLGGFEENYFLMGYQGQEDEFLDHLYIGNRDIAIDPYLFLDIPEQDDSSIGAEALLRTGASSHELLLRSDNNQSESRLYIGKNLVSEEAIPLSGYIAGRFFKLPDQGVEELEVYLEDANGDYSDTEGRHYRLAGVDDATLDSEEGLVFVKEAAAGGQVVVYYEKGVLAVGDVSLGSGALCEVVGGKLDPSAPATQFAWGITYLGQLLDDRQVTVNGRTGLRLWMAGEFSPFEILSRYEFSQSPPLDLSQVKVEVVKKGDRSQSLLQPVNFNFAPASRVFYAYHNSDLRGDFKNLYPFLDAASGGPFDRDNLLYGPERDPRPGYLKYELLVYHLTPVEQYRLEANVVPGSVSIKRNGMAESRYEVDYNSGLITFLTYIHPDDRIEISYRLKGAFLNNSDLLFAWGSRIPFSDSLNLELATGLRWNALPGSYTEKAYDRTGTVIGSVFLQGEGEKLSFKASTALAYTNPDTTGVMRLLSMEGQGMEVGLSEDTAYPASLPQEAIFAALSYGNRGKLFYRDYRDYGVFGTSSLQSYTWSGYKAWAYETGSKPGPYLAAGSSEGVSKGQSLIMDFEIDSAGDWVGCQIPLALNQGVLDLSALQSIFLSYRAIDVTGIFLIYLQIGDIDEDIDGDSTLDEEFSILARGFSFNDSANGVTLLVGGGPKNEGNGRRDSEDVDGNDFLDPEDPDWVLTVQDNGVDHFGDETDTSWSSFSAALGPAERAKLARSRGVRLIIIRQDAGSCSGRVLIDRLALAGSDFWVDASGFSATGTVTARQIEEGQALYPPPKELVDAFPEVEDTFHPFAEVQQVLEVDWQGGTAPTDDWSLQGFTGSGVEGIDYRRIVYYARLPTPLTGATIEFSLLDADNRGIRWQFDPEILAILGANWAKIEVDLDSKKVLLNGSEISGSSVTIDPSYGSLYLFKVSLENSSAGTLYLDELHLTDPRGAVGAAFGLDLDFSLPGELLHLGDYALVSNLSLSERAFFATAGFSTLYGRPLSASTVSSLTEVSCDLAFSQASANVQVAGVEQSFTLSGGHRVMVPNFSFPVHFSDSFSLKEVDTGRNIYRENTLDFTLPESLTLNLTASASSGSDILIQSWQSGLDIPVLSPFLVTTDLEFKRSKSGYSVIEEWYGSSWCRAYNLLFPWQQGLFLERKSGFDLGLSLATKPLGAELTAGLDFQSYDFISPTRRQKNELELTLQLPWELWAETSKRVTITPGYSRELRVMDTQGKTGDLSDDLRVYAGDIEQQSYFFILPPFAELFSGAAKEDFTSAGKDYEQAFYRPQASITIERLFSSRISDLFIPSFFQLSLDKEFKKDGDLVQFLNNYYLKTRNNAVNLFGSYGVYPIFSFYKLDEYGAGLTLTLTYDDNTFHSSDLLLEQYVGFETEKSSILTLDNRFNYQQTDLTSWSDEVQLSYKRFIYPPEGVKLPLLPESVERNGYYSHRESLALEISGEESSYSYHPMNIVLKHETFAIFPEQGLIKAEIALGLDRETSYDGNYWRLGIRAGIEGKIEF